MIEDLACVRLKRSIAPYPIPVGTTGAVVMVYDADPPGYEVEFFDNEGQTIQDPQTRQFTFTLMEEDLEVIP
ncbi:DUF4926 domain-containing protein [Prosthecobacter dejongeii]|uniref:DUF4926 domain-containing protein n=1 Tax=Prosthecobacter dejongeii TaxID=48465 RepID=A0A7W7YJK3_9BACT|nr:DUF4926 domain-containing protein [Prosthecobacter dejongeii]MBB5037411.1 hypothetical protein [Prosthecobacter dejongeii]